MSWGTSPVTHTAEVDVKRASRKDAPCPSLVARGSVRQRLPRRITSIKPKMITWNEETCLCIFSLNFALISHLRFCHIFRTCL